MDGGSGLEAGAVSKSDREVGGGSDCGMEMSQAWGKSMVGSWGDGGASQHGRRLVYSIRGEMICVSGGEDGGGGHLPIPWATQTKTGRRKSANN
jgi:hypothetical protein